MSNIRPTLSEFQEPEPGSQLEVGLGAFGRNFLWMFLLLLLGAAVAALSLNGTFLDQDAPRLDDNAALRAWSGIVQIWRWPHQFPDFSPLTYSSFLLEARAWGTGREHSAVGFRIVNLLIHAAAAIALCHLLMRLEMRGAWVAAAVFAVHPVNIASVTWISQRPALLGTLLGLLTLIVFFRLTGLNPRPEQIHPMFRLPDGQFALKLITSILALLTALASPAIAAVLGPAALVITWWDQAALRRRDFIAAAPLLAITALIAAVAAWLSLRQGGDLVLSDCPAWYRPIAIVQQYVFYAGITLVPLRLKFAYEPLGVFSAGALIMLVVGVMVLLAAVWLLLRWGRGPLATILLFVLVLLPAMIWVESAEIYGGWTGIQRLYPASAVVIVAVITTLATTTWAQTRREAAMAAAVILIGAAAGGGMIEAWKRASQLRLWNDVLAKNPRSMVALVRLADAAMNASEPSQAQAFLMRAIELDPADPAPLIKLGELDERRRQYDRAMFNFLKAQRLAPEDYEANFGLARVLAARGESTQALAQYEKVLALRSDDPVIHNNIGLIHAERGEVAMAAQDYRTALRLDPRCTAARINLANLLYQQGQTESAARELTTVLEIDRDNYQAFINAGAMLGQMREFSKAAMLFRRAIALRDDVPAGYSNLAMALIGQAQDQTQPRSARLAQLSEAAFLFEEAEKLDPRNPEYRKNATGARKMHEDLKGQIE